MNAGPSGIVVLTGMVCLAAPVALSQDFTWSWETEKEKPASTAPAKQAETNRPSPAAPFEWSFEAGTPSPAPAAGTTAPAAVSTTQPTAGAAEVSAYRELLKENLALRKQVEKAVADKESVETANQKLTKEISELDGRITESARMIQDLRTAQSAAGGDAGKLVELQGRLSTAESEKERLSRELEILRTKLSAAQPSGPPPPDSGVKPGSDLFRKIEAENAAMRARLVEIEKQRDEDRKAREKAELAAIAAAEDEKAAESKLEEAASHGAQDKARMEDVLSRIPELENKLAMAQAHQASQAPVAEKREAELASFREELARREYRLRKAEKMAAMLQEARRDVQKVSDREKRDMHYNMAAVYERDGRYREAEREYLQALEIDPSDAACHFNLGILYDDRLGDKRRAAIHYRRYLKLDPHSTDVDQVKSWLMKIDMD
jgi:tetratricopeptide (TPR) repeat protein